jgi:hypothetical protein
MRRALFFRGVSHSNFPRLRCGKICQGVPFNREYFPLALYVRVGRFSAPLFADNRPRSKHFASIIGSHVMQSLRRGYCPRFSVFS